MWPKRSHLEPKIQEAIERYGVDGVRSILTGMTDGRAGTGLGASVRLGDVEVSRKDMQDYLAWKNRRAALWSSVGVVAAVLAAIFSFLALFHAQ